MTIQFELNAEMEAQLAAEARVRGIPLEKAASVFCKKLWLLALCLRGI
jgi:hypothetical protein